MDNIESVRVDQISDLIVADRANRPQTQRNDPLARIDANNHYEFTSFGKALDVNNDLQPILNVYKGSWSREKCIWHVLNGKRLCIALEIQ